MSLSLLRFARHPTCPACSNWYDSLIQDYKTDQKEEYWWALSPTGRRITANLKWLIQGYQWAEVKLIPLSTPLPCLCFALLRAVQLCAPEDGEYYYAHCTNSVKDRMDKSFDDTQRSSMDTRGSRGVKDDDDAENDDNEDDDLDGYDEYMEEYLNEPDDYSEKLCASEFVRKEAKKNVEVHFSFLEDGVVSPCTKTAAREGYINVEESTFCITVSVRDLFGIEIFGKQNDRNGANGLVRKPNSTSSDASFEHALAWVEDCRQSHACIPRLTPYTVMPRRVIDVGNTFADDVKLHVLDGEVVTYIALSHCWGSNLNESPLKTLKATLSNHLQTIPLASLSKTFQDAIMFTRKLKIQYIWIDSLCIVQDDDMDWKDEIPKMGDIYRNCWLTLSAAKSADGSGGLFAETTPGVPIYFTDNGREVSFHARRVFSDKAAFPNMDEHLDMKVDRMEHDTDFPLFFRGWVMQERYLSPRTLYFCASELIWECSAKAHCECWGKSWGSTKSPWEDGYEDEPYEEGKYYEYFDWWLDFVQSYTSTQFTHASDKIPALFGINETLMKKLDHKGSPPPVTEGDPRLMSLLWERTESRPTYPDWVAPSWSWASADGKVVFQTSIQSSDINATIINFEWNAKDVNATSPKSQRVRDVLGTVRAQIDADGLSGHFIAQFMYSSRVIIRGTLLPINDELTLAGAGVPVPNVPFSAALYTQMMEDLQRKTAPPDPNAPPDAFWHECKFQTSLPGDHKRRAPATDRIDLNMIRGEDRLRLANLRALHMGNSYDGAQYFMLLQTENTENNIYRRVGMGVRKGARSEDGVTKAWRDRYTTTVVVI